MPRSKVGERAGGNPIANLLCEKEVEEEDEEEEEEENWLWSAGFLRRTRGGGRGGDSVRPVGSGSRALNSAGDVKPCRRRHSPPSSLKSGEIGIGRTAGS